MLVVEGLVVAVILGVVVAGTQPPATLIAFRLAPAAVVITVLWGVGLVLISRAQRSLPWHEAGRRRTASRNRGATAETAPSRTPPAGAFRPRAPLSCSGSPRS